MGSFGLPILGHLWRAYFDRPFREFLAAHFWYFGDAHFGPFSVPILGQFGGPIFGAILLAHLRNYWVTHFEAILWGLF